MGPGCGAERVKTLISPNEAAPEKPRPRDEMFCYVQDKLRMLQTIEEVSGKEAMMGYKREHRVMVLFKNLLEHLEQQELEKLAAADKKAKR